MAFICFKCKRQIPGDAKSLLTHLRVVHHVNHSSTYFQCSEPGCGRTFSFIRSFRRHLVKEHLGQSEYTPDDPLEGPAQPVHTQFSQPVQGDVEVEVEEEDECAIDFFRKSAYCHQLCIVSIPICKYHLYIGLFLNETYKCCLKGASRMG